MTTPREDSSLSLQDVSVRVRGKQLLGGVSLELRPGQLLALVGPNGAGKTTLLRVAIGLTRPSAGRARLAGRDVCTMSARDRAALIGWLPQHQAVTEPLSVREVVVAARYRFREARRTSEARAQAALERVNARSLENARIDELSGGERQRVHLAALLAQEPKLILLDEPASHLDPAQQLDVYRLLGDLWQQGLGVLLVTHDVNLIDRIGDAERISVLGLAAGRSVFQSRLGAPEFPRDLGRLFGVRFRALAHEGRRLLVPEPLEVPGGEA